MRTNIIKTTVMYVLVAILLIYVLFPFIWMVSSSFKIESEIRSVSPTLIPRTFTLENFRHVLQESYFLVYFRNSVVVSSITTFLSMVVAILAAYAVVRMSHVALFRSFAGGILISQLVPPVLLVMPLYVIMMKLRLLNTYWAMIVSYMTFGVPVCTWLLRGYFENIPREIEEAATVDGCGRLKVIMKIVLPVSAPGLLAASLCCFVLSWIEFLYAFTFVEKAVVRTLPPGLALYQGIWTINWGGLMAASVLTVVPVAMSFVFFQRYLIEGLTVGSVKG